MKCPECNGAGRLSGYEYLAVDEVEGQDAPLLSDEMLIVQLELLVEELKSRIRG